jgi:hypothetical protein
MLSPNSALAEDTQSLSFTVTVQDDPCPIDLPGDVNGNGSVTSADVIYLVGYILKSADPPRPCTANGDVNCDGKVSVGDIFYLINYYFKGGPPPCDICNASPLECVP